MNPTCLTHYFIRSKISSGCLGHRFNRDLKAERFKSLNEFVLERLRVEAIEVVSAKIPIFDWCLQMWKAMTRRVWAVAMVAFFTPRRAATLLNCAER